MWRLRNRGLSRCLLAIRASDGEGRAGISGESLALSTQPLDVADIVAEVLRVERDCAEALQAHQETGGHDAKRLSLRD
jgi:hypothetical protein